MPKAQEGKPIPKDLILGPSFFEGFSNFPGMKWVYSTPMVTENFTDCVSQASMAIESIGVNNLDALELGNEPDLYYTQHLQPPSWDLEKYVSQWKRYAAAVSENTILPQGPIFQGLVLYNRGV